ncbi:Manganese transporter SMF1 [Fusarium oxysporum f. sp. albedinis]|nr:Manganese transporter SMF1 [Fusarium oxysporum f. sp. albedinis]
MHIMMKEHTGKDIKMYAYELSKFGLSGEVWCFLVPGLRHPTRAQISAAAQPTPARDVCMHRAAEPTRYSGGSSEAPRVEASSQVQVHVLFPVGSSTSSVSIGQGDFCDTVLSMVLLSLCPALSVYIRSPFPSFDL